jgi:hypothetical protein
MKKLAYLCPILILMSVLNCSKKDNNPVEPDVTKNVIFYDSFEENGVGSLHNWSYFDSTYSKYFSFSTDVPKIASKYSLCIENDSISGPYIYRILRPQSSSNQRDLVFDFWAKGEGGTSLLVDFVFYGSDYGFSLLMDSDARWRNVADTLHDALHPYTPDFDSLKVQIGCINYDSTGQKVLLDDFKIIELVY